MINKFTQKAQNTLNHALTSARELGHTYVGSEHILLGILCEQDSIASKLLASRGADAVKIKASVIDISGIRRGVLCVWLLSALDLLHVRRLPSRFCQVL